MRLFSTCSRQTVYCTLRTCNYHLVSRVFNLILFTDVNVFGCGVIIIININNLGCTVFVFLCITTLLRTPCFLKLDALSQLIATVPTTSTPLFPTSFSPSFLPLCLFHPFHCGFVCHAFWPVLWHVFQFWEPCMILGIHCIQCFHNLPSNTPFCRFGHPMLSTVFFSVFCLCITMAYYILVRISDVTFYVVIRISMSDVLISAFCVFFPHCYLQLSIKHHP